MGLITKIFGDRNQKLLKQYNLVVEQVNALKDKYKTYSREDFLNLTQQFKERIEKGEDLDDIFVEAAAAIREVSSRTIGLRHFDVQIIGARVLFEGKIAEMKTGEGKTLVATIPMYIHALKGKGCHLVTVNDYLAKRDASWMGPIYLYMGLSVGIITSESAFKLDFESSDSSSIEKNLKIKTFQTSKREAYDCDITYGTNNEFGFDYLRDHMVLSKEDKVQRSHYYAIVDEVDSVLIDEARTPLIISGPSERSTDNYKIMNSILVNLMNSKKFVECSKDEEGEYLKDEYGRYLDDGAYRIDEKNKTCILTENGIKLIEEQLKNKKLISQNGSIYSPENIQWLSHAEVALKAHMLFQRERDYLVKDRQVQIVDEFTGRILPGRRFSGGLHQALEAKERVPIQQESQTLASISFQNYFRMYDVLAGMTGTAKTEEEEFYKIYNLEVVVIPTNKPIARIDHPDRIYRTVKEKEQAIVEEIIELHKKRQPVLVGTVSVEKSERISAMLKKRGIRHQVLNAKYHEKEAMIIRDAGRPGMVTIATNMAGRGTDIKLGGHDESQREEVLKAGGLFVLGTERHEARRIDNQLKGRSGRQGDPGASRFYISLEDDLMRLFGSERLSSILSSIGYKEGPLPEHKMISGAIEKAQKKVEQRNFDIRKHLLEYDDVLNKQRTYVYQLRDSVLEEEDKIFEIMQDQLNEYLWDKADEREIGKNINPEEAEELINFLNDSLNLKLKIEEFKNIYKTEDFIEKLKETLLNNLNEKLNRLEEKDAKFIVKAILLNTIDQVWKEHLKNVDLLEEAISLQSYSGKDPLTIYKLETFSLFESMLTRIHENSIKTLFLLEIKEKPVSLLNENAYEPVNYKHDELGQFDNKYAAANRNIPAQDLNINRFKSSEHKLKNPYKGVGRNDPCPCGSGKKFKNCHGKYL